MTDYDKSSSKADLGLWLAFAAFVLLLVADAARVVAPDDTGRGIPVATQCVCREAGR